MARQKKKNDVSPKALKALNKALKPEVTVKKPRASKMLAKRSTPMQWIPEKRRIGDLIPDHENPRSFTEKGMDNLKESLSRFGLAEPICVNTDGGIIGGHARIKALTEMYGPDYEDFVFVAPRKLKRQEVKELLVRLNKNVAGVFDYDMLANCYDAEDLLAWGFEPDEIGFDVEDDDGDTGEGEGDGKGEKKTFALTKSQLETVERAISYAKRTENIDDSDTDASNGNALFVICLRYLEEAGEDMETMGRA